MHFQIFIPHQAGVDHDHLDAVGLADLRQPGDLSPNCSDLPGTGPGGLPGQIWSWDRPGVVAETGFFPDRQHWEPAKPAGDRPAGRYWLGVSIESPPTPAEIARTHLVPGPVETLGDDQAHTWQVPSALAVPQVMTLDDAGQWTTRPSGRYRRFVERSTWALSACLATIEQGTPVPLSDAADYALEALQWNYRLPRELADRLGLFAADQLFRILALTTDLDRLRAIVDSQKKAAGPPTPSG